MKLVNMSTNESALDLVKRKVESDSLPDIEASRVITDEYFLIIKIKELNKMLKETGVSTELFV
jgi:hypothetical protein